MTEDGELSNDLDAEISDCLAIHGYTLGDWIGGGASSSCFRVFSVQYQDYFVCKMIPKENDFNSELEFLSQLFHPNIIQCYSYFQSPSLHYLILEECTGGNLSDFIKEKGPMNQKMLLKMYFQLLSALEYLHKRNIAHMDIKPANILINKFGNPKLADFGLSHMVKQNKCCSYVGTKIFVAPEVSDTIPYDPMRADIYSLGVTFYTLLTGYDYETMNNIMNMYLNMNVLPFPPQTTKTLQTILTGSVNKNPGERLSISELKSLLKDEFENQGVPMVASTSGVQSVNATAGSFRISRKNSTDCSIFNPPILSSNNTFGLLKKPMSRRNVLIPHGKTPPKPFANRYVSRSPLPPVNWATD